MIPFQASTNENKTAYAFHLFFLIPSSAQNFKLKLNNTNTRQKREKKTICFPAETDSSCEASKTHKYYVSIMRGERSCVCIKMNAFLAFQLRKQKKESKSSSEPKHSSNPLSAEVGNTKRNSSSTNWIGCLASFSSFSFRLYIMVRFTLSLH